MVSDVLTSVTVGLQLGLDSLTGVDGGGFGYVLGG
jgi:hypothetical protein